jgi:peptidoglycan LD-endopeptidase CwlK
MASRKLEDCDPKLAKAYLECVEEYKKLYPDYPEPFITCTWRSNEEQEELYMMSRNGKDDDGDGKIDEPDEWRTNARAGQSKHNLRPSKALDIAFPILTPHCSEFSQC